MTPIYVWILCERHKDDTENQVDIISVHRSREDAVAGADWRWSDHDLVRELRTNEEVNIGSYVVCVWRYNLSGGRGGAK